jgi:hypothetical protein
LVWLPCISPALAALQAMKYMAKKKKKEKKAGLGPIRLPYREPMVWALTWLRAKSSLHVPSPSKPSPAVPGRLSFPLPGLEVSLAGLSRGFGADKGRDRREKGKPVSHRHEGDDRTDCVIPLRGLSRGESRKVAHVFAVPLHKASIVKNRVNR